MPLEAAINETTGTGRQIVFIDDARTFGGAQIALAQAIRTILRNTNHSVVCVCPTRTVEEIVRIVGANTKVRFVTCPAALPLNILTFVPRIIPFFKILHSLKSQGIATWWLNLSGIESCVAALVILKALGESYMSWLHCPGTLSALFRGTLARRILNRSRDLIADHLLFRLHPRLVTPTRAASEVVRQRAFTNTQVPHLYPALSRTAPSCSESREAPICPKPQVALWMIGRVELGTKNNAAAIHAFYALTSRGFATSLTVVGDGPDMEQLKLHASGGPDDRLTFSGWSTDPWATVGLDDVVLIPSLYEGGVTLVAIEAMLRGIRIVTTPLPTFYEGIPEEFIAGGFSGSELADQVERVLNIDRMQAGRLYAKYLTQYSEEHFIQSFFQISTSS
jgi:glycosyltransferase involved in cell wall biosynthesis